MSIPPRPPLAYLLTSDAHTPEEDIILVRSSAKNPIGSCFRGIAIQPGGLGYQTRAMVANWPSLVPYTPPPAPAQARPTLAPEPAPEAAPPEAPPTPAPEPARTMSAREAVAFIEAAGPGEYEHLRSDPRRSVKDAIADRDMDLRAAGLR
jgi:hypothetical protein